MKRQQNDEFSTPPPQSKRLRMEEKPPSPESVFESMREPVEQEKPIDVKRALFTKKSTKKRARRPVDKTQSTTVSLPQDIDLSFLDPSMMSQSAIREDEKGIDNNSLAQDMKKFNEMFDKNNGVDFMSRDRDTHKMATEMLHENKHETDDATQREMDEDEYDPRKPRHFNHDVTEGENAEFQEQFKVDANKNLRDMSESDIKQTEEERQRELLESLDDFFRVEKELEVISGGNQDSLFNVMDMPDANIKAMPGQADEGGEDVLSELQSEMERGPNNPFGVSSEFANPFDSPAHSIQIANGMGSAPSSSGVVRGREARSVAEVDASAVDLGSLMDGGGGDGDDQKENRLKLNPNGNFIGLNGIPNPMEQKSSIMDEFKGLIGEESKQGGFYNAMGGDNENESVSVEERFKYLNRVNMAKKSSRFTKLMTLNRNSMMNMPTPGLKSLRSDNIDGSTGTARRPKSMVDFIRATKRQEMLAQTEYDI